MKKILLLLIFWCYSSSIFSQADKVSVDKSSSGIKLKVNGNDFIINGVNWDYTPIGTNYSYSLYNQPESVIKQALDDEMSLLKNMGVNTIRVYTGIPKKWIEYIHTKFGITFVRSKIVYSSIGSRNITGRAKPSCNCDAILENTEWLYKFYILSTCFRQRQIPLSWSR